MHFQIQDIQAGPKPKFPDEGSEPVVEEDDPDVPDPLHEFPDKKGEDPDGRPPARMSD